MNVIANHMRIPLGIIVTFNPPSNFFANLDLFYNQFNQLLIVDNGSNPDIRRLLKQEIQLRGSCLNVIFNEKNYGIAKALNQGFYWALAQDYNHVITFDQDSHPTPGMLSAMQDVFDTYSIDGHLAIVAPIVGDSLINKKARYLRSQRGIFFERVFCEGNVLDNVSSVITSGSLYDLAIYQHLGPFREDFFIDYVDTEYCLRAKQNGYRIMVACNAFLDHRLGNQQKRYFLGQEHYPTFHSSFRWYYIGRNRIQMLKSYALQFPHWLTYEIIASLYMLIRMLFFEKQKKAKMWAMMRGTLDGVLGIKQLERY